MAQRKEEKNRKERLRYQQNKKAALERTNEWRRKDREANPEKYKKIRKDRYDKLKKENPEYWKSGHYKSKYGISLEEYNIMFAKQEGKCECCGKHQTELKVSLCVDHDHNTGKVRSLLCNNCNTSFGLLAEDPERIEKLKQYALKHKK